MTDPDLSTVWYDSGWWLMPDGTRRLLSWNAGTKELRLWGLTDRQKDIVLAVIDTEDEVHRRLQGWESYNDTPEGLGWLAGQLKGCR